jgi:hypothetical protein
MAALHHRRVEAPVTEGDEPRQSGVHRTAGRVSPDIETHSAPLAGLEQPPSQRPTRPAAPRSLHPANDDVYQRIASGPLGKVAAAPELRRRKPWNARTITRDLLQRVGSFDQVPTRVQDVEMESMHLRPRHAFILHLVDGSLSVASIIDASPLPMDEVLELLTELVSYGLVSIP